MPKLDLSDLLDGTGHHHNKAKVVSLDDLLRKPRKSREAIEVVLFWTDWTCACGRHYEMPTYGDTLTRYDQYQFGKKIGTVYDHFLPVCHASLPRRVEERHIAIPHCPQCLHETQLIEDLSNA